MWVPNKPVLHRVDRLLAVECVSLEHPELSNTVQQLATLRIETRHDFEKEEI